MMCSPCLVVEEVHCQAWCNTASASISSNLASSGCIQPIKQEKASGLKGGLGGITKMTVSFPLFTGLYTSPGGAGFLPSTVSYITSYRSQGLVYRNSTRFWSLKALKRHHVFLRPNILVKYEDREEPTFHQLPNYATQIWRKFKTCFLDIYYDFMPKNNTCTTCSKRVRLLNVMPRLKPQDFFQPVSHQLAESNDELASKSINIINILPLKPLFRLFIYFQIFGSVLRFLPNRRIFQPINTSWLPAQKGKENCWDIGMANGFCASFPRKVKILRNLWWWSTSVEKIRLFWWDKGTPESSMINMMLDLAKKPT